MRILIIVLACVRVSFAQQEVEFSFENLKQHIEYLASDELEGRKPGTVGGKLAATYIRDAFQEAGLEFMEDQGFQYFDVVTSTEYGKHNLVLWDGKPLAFQKDYVPLSFSKNDESSGEIVFAGFGMQIEQQDLKRNDYENIQAKGKWVLVLRGDPEPDNDTSLFIPYSDDRSKAIFARDAGARGLILAGGSKNYPKDELVELADERKTADAGIPVIQITREKFSELLPSQNIDSLEMAVIKGVTEKQVVLGSIIAKTDLEKKKVQTQNIIAYIKGSDPVLMNEYVIVGAHYDHLGMGGPGSGSRTPDTTAVHNGADDNASGVAGLIELAAQMNAPEQEWKRTVIFMAFGAEEMGLLGSQFFTKYPHMNLADVTAMVNFDMIGRLDTEKQSVMIAGTGTSVEAESILDKLDETSTLSFAYSPEGYGASDHASFYAEDVPVFFFSTGAHADYHTPDDDADKINYEGEALLLETAYELMVELVNRKDRLVFKEAGPRKQSSYGRGLKVKLGIMPDFTSTENNGLGVGGVTKDGPAYKGGMLKGDRITAIDGKPISNIYDYMNRLKQYKPGQRISVDIIRDGSPRVLLIML